MNNDTNLTPFFSRFLESNLENEDLGSVKAGKGNSTHTGKYPSDNDEFYSISGDDHPGNGYGYAWGRHKKQD